MKVKGKSAKRGHLSGLVPFLQISDEAHKHKLPTSPVDALIRVYYTSAARRDEARQQLEATAQTMAAKVAAAKAPQGPQEVSSAPIRRGAAWLSKRNGHIGMHRRNQRHTELLHAALAADLPLVKLEQVLEALSEP